MAMFNIGLSYAQGHGVMQSNSEAMDWYHKAAESADPVARQAADHAIKELQARRH